MAIREPNKPRPSHKLRPSHSAQILGLTFRPQVSPTIVCVWSKWANVYLDAVVQSGNIGPNGNDHLVQDNITLAEYVVLGLE